MQAILCAIRMCVLGLFLAVPSAFAASGYDYSDSWWNPAESGWGLQLVQQRDIVFATLYVYGTDGTARWYSGALPFTGLTRADARAELRGRPLPDDGTVVRRRCVRAVRGRLPQGRHDADRGRQHDACDAVLRGRRRRRPEDDRAADVPLDDYAGDYAGAFIVTTSKCTNPANDGTRTLPATLAVTQAGTAMTIVAALPGKSCSYTGPYTQNGRLGQLAAGFVCTNGEVGTLFFEEMSVQRFGFMGRLFGVDNAGCHIEGSFAAAR